MLVAVILGMEITFWVLIAAGLVARYLLGWRRTGAVLLALSPAVDLVILTASVYDLRHGATAGIPHVLSAIYLGVSVAWGHRMIHWADVRFAHRFAGGPAPVPKPAGGEARARFELSQLRRHLTAWAVGAGLLGAGIWLVNDLDRTQMLIQAAVIWTVVLVIDAVVTFGDVVTYRGDERAAARRRAAGEQRQDQLV
jgi:hypothetical protein